MTNRVGLIGMRVSHGGGDLKLYRPTQETRNAVRVLNGLRIYPSDTAKCRFPGNHCLILIFQVARMTARPSVFESFPRASLEKMADDRDYVMGVYALADEWRESINSASSWFTYFIIQDGSQPYGAYGQPALDLAMEKRNRFIEAIKASEVRLVDICNGYGHFLNNFRLWLPGMLYRMPGARDPNIFPLLDQAIVTVTGRKAEEVADELYNCDVSAGAAEDELRAAIEKRRLLYRIMEIMVCQHGLELSTLRA